MGKTALITDVLQGIGGGIARTFTRHGADLTLLDISPEIEKLADELCDHGRRCTAVVANVCDPTPVATATKRAKEKEGRTDILVSSVSVCRLGSPLNMSDKNRNFHIDINIKGVWNVTKVVLPEMTARKDGRIVVMSSIIGGMVANPGGTVYILTKATIVGLTKPLAVEYVQSGTRVNTICPGYVRILVAESIVRQPNPEDPESVLTETAEAIPMRRLADPLEVGELAAFLVSDRSSYLTGIQNVTDGGSTLPGTVSVDI